MGGYEGREMMSSLLKGVSDAKLKEVVPLAAAFHSGFRRDNLDYYRAFTSICIKYHR
jgi:hypothetical protein